MKDYSLVVAHPATQKGEVWEVHFAIRRGMPDGYYVSQRYMYGCDHGPYKTQDEAKLKLIELELLE